jgi:hypothetical protein
MIPGHEARTNSIEGEKTTKKNSQQKICQWIKLEEIQ